MALLIFYVQVIRGDRLDRLDAFYSCQAKNNIRRSSARSQRLFLQFSYCFMNLFLFHNRTGILDPYQPINTFHHALKLNKKARTFFFGSSQSWTPEISDP